MAQEFRAKRTSDFSKEQKAFDTIIRMLSKSYGKHIVKFFEEKVNAISSLLDIKTVLDIHVFMESARVLKNFFEEVKNIKSEDESGEEKLKWCIDRVMEVQDILRKKEIGACVSNNIHATRNASLRTELEALIPGLKFASTEYTSKTDKRDAAVEQHESLHIKVAAFLAFLTQKQQALSEAREEVRVVQMMAENERHIAHIKTAIQEVIQWEVAHNMYEAAPYSTLLLNKFEFVLSRSGDAYLAEAIPKAIRSLQEYKVSLLHVSKKGQEASAVAQEGEQEVHENSISAPGSFQQEKEYNALVYAYNYTAELLQDLAPWVVLKKMEPFELEGIEEKKDVEESVQEEIKADIRKAQGLISQAMQYEAKEEISNVYSTELLERMVTMAEILGESLGRYLLLEVRPLWQEKLEIEERLAEKKKQEVPAAESALWCMTSLKIEKDVVRAIHEKEKHIPALKGLHDLFQSELKNFHTSVGSVFEEARVKLERNMVLQNAELVREKSLLAGWRKKEFMDTEWVSMQKTNEGELESFEQENGQLSLAFVGQNRSQRSDEKARQKWEEEEIQKLRGRESHLALEGLEQIVSQPIPTRGSRSHSDFFSSQYGESSAAHYAAAVRTI